MALMRGPSEPLYTKAVAVGPYLVISLKLYFMLSVRVGVVESDLTGGIVYSSARIFLSYVYVGHRNIFSRFLWAQYVPHLGGLLPTNGNVSLYGAAFKSYPHPNYMLTCPKSPANASLLS